MTLSAPTRLNALRGLQVDTGRNAQHVLIVEFTSPDGGAWHAVGGGDTVADAIAFARGSCPTRTTWRASSWSDLHGD